MFQINCVAVNVDILHKNVGIIRHHYEHKVELGTTELLFLGNEVVERVTKEVNEVSF